MKILRIIFFKNQSLTKLIIENEALGRALAYVNSELDEANEIIAKNKKVIDKSNKILGRN